MLPDRTNWKDLLWIFSWSCIGIGAGLLNSRTDKSKNNEGNLNEHMHYIVYYPFVLFMSILASFALSREGGYLDYPKSTLIAVTLGFAAERIHDLLSGKITT